MPDRSTSFQWAPISIPEVVSILRAELGNDEDQIFGVLYDLDAGAVYGTLDGRVLRDNALGGYQVREAAPVDADDDWQGDLLRRIAEAVQ